MENNKIGPKRLVVGAHYGLRDWLAQRATAMVMAVYTVILLVSFLTASDFSYQGWAGLFSHTWFKMATTAALAALFFHAWIGVRDAFMDYVKPMAIRLVLQIAAILWLVACAAWAAHILWRM